MSNTKHFKKGSEQPALPKDGLLRLYSMRFCPYAARAHLVLDAKNIPYHTLNINLTEKPEWLFDVNPIGKVPAVQLVNEPEAPFLSESLIIMEYLDEKYPEPKLMSADPLKRAQDRLWIERFNAVAAAFNRGSVNTSELQKVWQEVLTALDPFEAELQKRGTALFGGKSPNIVDYAIWPWLQRIEIALDLFGPGCDFDKAKYPALTRFHKTLLKSDKAVQKCYIPKDIHVKYFESRRAGSVSYDLLVPPEN